MHLLVALLVSLALPLTLAGDALGLNEEDKGLASDEYYEYYEVEEDLDHEVPERLRQYIKSLPNPLTVQTNYSPHEDLISSSGKVHDSKYGRESNTQSSSKQHKRLGKHQKHHKRHKQNEHLKKEEDIKHQKIPDNTKVNEATQIIPDNILMDKHEEKINSGGYSDRVLKEKTLDASLYSPENKSLVIQEGNEKFMGIAHDENKKQTMKLSNFMHEGEYTNVDMNNLVSNHLSEQSKQQGEVEHGHEVETTMSEVANSIPSKDKTVNCETGDQCSKDNKKDVLDKAKKLKSSTDLDHEYYDTIVGEQKTKSLDGSDSKITLSGSVNSTVQTNEADRYETSHFLPGSGTELKEQTGESPSSAIRKTYAEAVVNGLERQESSTGSLNNSSLQNSRKIKEFSQTLSNVVADNNVHKEDIQDKYEINEPSKTYNSSYGSTEKKRDDLNNLGYSSSVNNYDHSILNNSTSVLESGSIHNNMEIIKSTANDHQQYNQLTHNNKNNINEENLIITNGTNNNHEELIGDLMTQMKNKTTKKTTKKRIKKRQRNNSTSKQQSQVTINDTEVEVSGDIDRDASEPLTELNGLKPIQDGVGQDLSDNHKYETYNYSQSDGQTGRFSNFMHEEENENVVNNKMTSSTFKKSTDTLTNDLTESHLPNGNVKKNLQNPKEVEMVVQSPSGLVTESTMNREDSQNKYLIDTSSPSKSLNYSILTKEERRGSSLDHTSNFLVVNHDDHLVVDHPSSLTPNSEMNVNSMDITKQEASGNKQYIKETNKNNNQINEEKFVSSKGTKSDHEQVVEDFFSHLAKKATTKTIKKRIKKKRRNKSKKQQSQVNFDNTEITELEDGNENDSEFNSQTELDDVKLSSNGLGRNGNYEFANTSLPNQSNGQTSRLSNFQPEEDHSSVGTNVVPSSTILEKPPRVLVNDLTRSEQSTGDLTNNSQKDNAFAHTSSEFETEHSVYKGDIQNIPSHQMVQDNNSTLISGIDVNNMEINKQLVRDGKQYTKESIENNNKINENYLTTSNGTANDHEQVIEEFIGHLAKKATKKTIKKRIKKKFKNKSNTKQKETTKEKNTKNLKLMENYDQEKDNTASNTEDVYQKNPIDGYSQNEKEENNHVKQENEGATGNNIASSSVADQHNEANKSDYEIQTNKNLTSYTAEEFNRNEALNNVHSDDISEHSETDVKKYSKNEGTYIGQNEAEDFSTTQSHSRIQENINDISSGQQGKLNLIVSSYKPIVNPTDSKILENLTSRPVTDTRTVVSNNNYYIVSGGTKNTNSIDGKHTWNVETNNKYIVSGDGKETNSVGGKVEHMRNEVSNINDIVSGDSKEINSIYGKSHTYASSDQHVNKTSNALTSNFQNSLVENTVDREIRDDLKSESHSGTIFESNENNEVSQTYADGYSKTESDLGKLSSKDCLTTNCIGKPHIERTEKETNLHSKYVAEEGSGKTKFDSVNSDTENTEVDGTENVASVPHKKGCPSNFIKHETDTEVHKGSNECMNVICSMNALRLSNLCKNINKIINLADQDKTGSTYEIVIKVQSNSNGEQNNDKIMNEGTEQIKTNINNTGSEFNSLTKFFHDNHFMNSLNNEEYTFNALDNDKSQISQYQTKLKNPIQLDMVKLDQSNEFSKMNIDNFPLDTVIEEDVTTKIKAIAGNRLVSKITRKKSVTRSQPLRNSVPNQLFKS